VEWGQGKLGRFQPLKPHNSPRFASLIFTIFVFLILFRKSILHKLIFYSGLRSSTDPNEITAASFFNTGGERLIKGCEQNRRSSLFK
jgi:hypothetical protein